MVAVKSSSSKILGQNMKEETDTEMRRSQSPHSTQDKHVSGSSSVIAASTGQFQLPMFGSPGTNSAMAGLHQLYGQSTFQLMASLQAAAVVGGGVIPLNVRNQSGLLNGGYPAYLRDQETFLAWTSGRASAMTQFLPKGQDSKITMSPPETTSPPSNGSSSGGKSTDSSNGGRRKPENGRDKVFSCPTCSRTFGYKHVLQNHERTHTGEKPFACNQCGKRFTRDHHLKTHLRLHTGEKPYQCSHCDRQFVQVANLRRHLRVHTGERPYACEMCTSRFSDSNQLKAHMLIHKGEKPFSCTKCTGRFRRRHHLLHHKCPAGGVKIEEEPPRTPSSFNEEMMTDDDLLEDEERPSSSERSPSRPSISPEELLRDSLQEKKRERKPKETRRVIRPTPSPVGLSMAVGLVAPQRLSPMPEQTEPEDLSMSNPRRPTFGHGAFTDSERHAHALSYMRGAFQS